MDVTSTDYEHIYTDHETKSSGPDGVDSNYIQIRVYVYTSSGLF